MQTLDFSGEGETVVRGRRVEGDYELGLDVVELGLARTLGRLATDSGRDATIDAFAGGRFNRSDVSLDLDAAGLGTFEPEGGNGWVDAFVGVRLRLPFAGPFDAVLRGDVGGFGIGESADLATTVEAALEIALADRGSLVAGWRRYAFERDAHDRETDVDFSGPFLGPTIRF